MKNLAIGEKWLSISQQLSQLLLPPLPLLLWSAANSLITPNPLIFLDPRGLKHDLTAPSNSQGFALLLCDLIPSRTHNIWLRQHRGVPVCKAKGIACVCLGI